MNFWFKNYIHFTYEEAIAILALRNRPSVRNNMYNTHEITVEDHLNWIKNLKHRKDGFYWGIYCENRLVGSIDLTRVDRENMFSEWGFFMDEQHLGLGAVIEFLAMEHFIKNLKFKTVLAGVHSDNKKVYHLHKVKFGYEEAPAYDTECHGNIFYGLTLSDENWGKYRLKVKTILDKRYTIESVVWDEIAL